MKLFHSDHDNSAPGAGVAVFLAAVGFAAGTVMGFWMLSSGLEFDCARYGAFTLDGKSYLCEVPR